MTEIIDGNAIAADIRGELSDAVDTLADAGTRPGLATVLIGDDPASETYVRMKQRDCEELGINGTHVDIEGDADESVLLDHLDSLNNDPTVHGYLVQSPVPDHIDYQSLIERIDPRKDVDGFHPENVGRFVLGTPRFLPCTPHGIVKLLDASDIDTTGADVTIVGRSNIVGKPLANILLQDSETANATVTVCHSRTTDLRSHTKDADILVAACGVPELIDASMVGEDAVIVDVGIERVDADTEKGYRLVGDVDFDDVVDRVSAITPVPGGVGPMTRAMLMYNTVLAASEQSGVAVDLP